MLAPHALVQQAPSLSWSLTAFVSRAPDALPFSVIIGLLCSSSSTVSCVLRCIWSQASLFMYNRSLSLVSDWCSYSCCYGLGFACARFVNIFIVPHGAPQLRQCATTTARLWAVAACQLRSTSAASHSTLLTGTAHAAMDSINAESTCCGSRPRDSAHNSCAFVSQTLPDFHASRACSLTVCTHDWNSAMHAACMHACMSI